MSQGECRLPVAAMAGEMPSPDHDGVHESRTWSVLPSSYGTVVRCSMTVYAAHDHDVIVQRVPTLRMTLDPGTWTAHWFVSDWGDEFTPRSEVLGADDLRLEVSTGRSSKGCHPWLSLSRDDGASVIVSPAWSGNWQITVSLDDAGQHVVSGGISDWCFSRLVSSNQPFVAPDVYVAYGSDRITAGAALAHAVSCSVLPINEDSQSLSVAWNHWWPYEDALINADVFLANASIAARMGLDQVTLDAGWFGPSTSDSFWERVRGDWHQVNTSRFPGGLADLAHQVRQLGLNFGLWVEAEAVGPDAQVAHTHPKLLARGVRQDPKSDPGGTGVVDLGYICLGSPAGRDHVLASVDRLVRDNGCRWIKWDFNLDPGQGCTRTDHGHDSGDGLYEHYRGLYSILDTLRHRHPDLVLESCSSGGLRIDLGLLSHVHTSFLSDPDWTEFHLQLLWGASQMLPAQAIFHFSESQWRTFHPLQNLHPEALSMAEIDVLMRAVLLHRFALSYRLVDMPESMRERIQAHIAIFRDSVVPLIAADGIIRALTDQPLREGRGCRFPAFQLTSGHQHVITVFHLPGAPSATTVLPQGLEPTAVYRVRLLGPDADPRDVSQLSKTDGTITMTGVALMKGLDIHGVSGAVSWMFELMPINQAPDR